MKLSFGLIPRRLSSNSRRFGTSIGSIFMGRSMKYDQGWGVCCISTWKPLQHKLKKSKQPPSTLQRTHRTYIPPTAPPLPVVTPPTPSGHSPSHWLLPFPTTPLSGINTPHTPSPVILHPLPMKMEPIEGSETSAIRTQTPGNYPKESIIH